MYVANEDFDPSTISASFPSEEDLMCLDVPVVSDTLVGESREVFAVSFSVPETEFSVQIGQFRTAMVVISDIPGEYCLDSSYVKMVASHLSFTMYRTSYC